MMKFAIAAVLACSKQALAQAPAPEEAGWWTPKADSSISASTMEGGKDRFLSGPLMPKADPMDAQRSLAISSSTQDALGKDRFLSGPWMPKTDPMDAQRSLAISSSTQDAPGKDRFL